MGWLGEVNEIGRGCLCNYSEVSYSEKIWANFTNKEVFCFYTFQYSKEARRNGDKKFANFLAISLDSAFELETQLLILYQIEICRKNIIKKMLVELDSTCKMLHVLKKRFTKNLTTKI